MTVSLEVLGTEVNSTRCHAPNGTFTVPFELDLPLGTPSFTTRDVTVRVDGSPVRRTAPHRVIGRTDVLRATVIDIAGDADECRRKVACGAPLAVIASYRPRGRGPAAVRQLVSGFRSAGIAVVLVDTSDRTVDVDADVVVHRRNRGWDFASWLAAFEVMPWIASDPTRLILANDSVFGPICGLDGLLAAGGRLGVDVWGVTDSPQIAQHLQSYFLAFEASAVHSGAVESFARTYTFPERKIDVVRHGEVALSRHLVEHGLELSAVFEYGRLATEYLERLPSRIADLTSRPESAARTAFRDGRCPDIAHLLDTAEQIRSGRHVNPSHRFYDLLLEFGSPFVKRELFTLNPERLPRIALMNDLIDDATVVDVMVKELGTWVRRPTSSTPESEEGGRAQPARIASLRAR